VNKGRGFTLIELMVVVAIIAIVAAIALPSYIAQVRHSRRSEVQGAMQSAALGEERVRADCSTYASAWSSTPTGCTSGATMGGNPYTSSYYTLALSCITSTSYMITATAVGTQANDTASGTGCSPLVYVYGDDVNCSSNASYKGVVTKSPSQCWTQ